MSDPSRARPDAATDQPPGGELDPTLAHPGGPPSSLVPRADAELNFGPPVHPGEVGTLGRYRILKKLGKGGMGAVYLALDTTLARRLALKLMLPQYAADAEARERFLREARAAAVVRSDHVVTIFDVGEERGAPFIAMEYLLGHPLDQFLREQGNPSLAHVIRIGRETALGLAAAHKLGLIHRDVKPGNIWLEAPRGRVKLLDFGLARAADDDTHLTDSGLVVGTPAFMSPEQARGLKLDPRSDLFSLGVMLYRLATGKMPFTGSTTMAVLTSLAVDTPAPARQVKPTVPEGLEAVIARLLAKDPADRFPSAREVAEALAEVEAERQRPGAGQGPAEAVPMAIDAQTEFVQAELVPDAGDESGSSPQVLSTEPVRKKAARRKTARKRPAPGPRAWPLAAAGAALAGAAVLAALLLWPSKGTLAVESDDPDVEVVVKRDGTVVRDRTRDREFKLKTGTYTVELAGRPERWQLAPDKVEVTRNGRATVRVTANKGGGGKPPPQPPATGSDRKAAEYVLSVGGRVWVNGDAREITSAADLKEPFTLTRVALSAKAVTDDGLAAFRGCKNLRELVLDRTNVTDAGLAHFKDCTNLTVLDLGETKITEAGLENFKGCTALATLSLHLTPVTDAGLAHFKDCKSLKYLRLSRTAVTDKGLAHFRGCKGLGTLVLYQTATGDEGLSHFNDCKLLKHLDVHLTAVTGAGLEPFKECKGLLFLYVQGTKVAPERVSEFATAVPACRIVCDGATFDGTDRRGAEYALSLGGYVEVELSGVAREYRAGTALPKEPFALRMVNVSALDTVTDAGLSALAGCKNLRTAYLNNCRGISDAGMVHLEECTALSVVRVSTTAVTDKGLARLKGRDLTFLSVEYTAVSDAGLAPFKECKTLTFLDVRKSNVSEAMVREFAKTLPKCKIVWDKGTIEAPRK